MLNTALLVRRHGTAADPEMPATAGQQRRELSLDQSNVSYNRPRVPAIFVSVEEGREWRCRAARCVRGNPRACFFKSEPGICTVEPSSLAQEAGGSGGARRPDLRSQRSEHARSLFGGQRPTQGLSKAGRVIGADSQIDRGRSGLQRDSDPRLIVASLTPDGLLIAAPKTFATRRRRQCPRGDAPRTRAHAPPAAGRRCELREGFCGRPPVALGNQQAGAFVLDDVGDVGVPRRHAGNSVGHRLTEDDGSAAFGVTVSSSAAHLQDNRGSGKVLTNVIGRTKAPVKVTRPHSPSSVESRSMSARCGPSPTMVHLKGRPRCFSKVCHGTQGVVHTLLVDEPGADEDFERGRLLIPGRPSVGPAAA